MQPLLPRRNSNKMTGFLEFSPEKNHFFKKRCFWLCCQSKYVQKLRQSTNVVTLAAKILPLLSGTE